MIDLGRDFARLTQRLKEQKEVKIPLRGLETEEEIFVYGLITKALSYTGQIRLDGTIQLVICEFLRNAEKALLKRAFAEFFAKATDYDNQEFLRTFHQKLKDGLKPLRSILYRGKPTIEFVVQLQANGLTFVVKNQGLPSVREDELIHDGLRHAARATDLNELAAGELNQNDGEGYGLGVAYLALKAAGLEPWTYEIESGSTIFSINVPGTHITPEDLDRIDKTLFQEVQSLPAFPEHVRRMMEVCTSPESDMKQVAVEIGRDAGITSQIIRLANSGGFAGGRVADITEAVKIIGLSTIAGLLMKVGAYTILEARYGASEEMLAHPVRVAVYSRLLARKFKMAAVADQAYVAGLLHDIGKLVILHHMKRNGTQTAADRIGKRRDRRSQINMEEISCGADHALIGQILGEKWNFPPDLCKAIGCHHTPLAASAETRKLIFTVYLANAFADYEEGQTSFYFIEPDVLEHFNLTTQAAFEMLAGALNSQFLSG
ncbi:MAG: HDOD domain-containing protein [Spirochaetia bacterium]|nr:HDOD domain-containing protein [Spirochaetia bacterium]